jgi:hypothetical protein
MKKLKPPQIKSPQIKAPRIVSDLYRDLRDRRLLLPIVAVLVAIVAVPVVLKSQSSGSPAPVADAPSSVGDEVTAVEPAVLVADSGIRDYRKRLDALKSKNPFEQKFALPTPESVALEGGSGDGGGSTDTSSTSVSDTITAPSTGAGEPSSSSTAVTDTTVTDNAGDVTTSTDTVTTDTSSGDGESKPPKTITRFYAGRIDVTVGPLGDAKRLDDVRVLDFLPSDKNPVVAFLGLSHGADAAVFSVSRDVVETEGDGSCSPKQPAPCQYLTLKSGGQQTFTFADGTTYRLRLLHTNVVAVPDPRAQQGADQADSPGD